MLKFYNTLTRSVDDFKPITGGVVSLYTCGPTVYDFAHIGNWRSFIFDDTLRRLLQASGYEVKHVMNITDVGHLTDDADEGRDKLETGAAKEGKSVWDVAKHYTQIFKSDAQKLNILEPNAYKGPKDSYARATDFIESQIEMIKLLLERGYAYKTKHAIYFDVTKLPDYGKLSGQKLDEKEVGARSDVVTDKNKQHPQDFALWFFLVGRFVQHEMNWPSPWGNGFPGWHLECSAIIHSTLGDPIDIHTGGVDHIGTHHPNEMAQTEGAFGHKLANYWLHNEFVLVDGHKMAKSQANYYTLEDIVKRGYDPLALRLLFLQAHYRKQINFTWDSLSAAQNLLNNFRAWSDLQFQNFESSDLKTNYKIAFGKFVESMNNDMATPEALGWFNGMVNRTDSLGVDSESIRNYAQKVDKYLGLGLSDRTDISDEQKTIISDREIARQNKEWERADELRNQLLEQKLEISDTSSGSTWSRVT